MVFRGIAKRSMAVKCGRAGEVMGGEKHQPHTSNLDVPGRPVDK